VLAAAVCALVAGCGRDQPKAPAGRVVAIRGARVFDGERVLPRATVILRGATIAAVGVDEPVPAGAEVIEGAGKTLLPGLIDAHAHRQERDAALEQALALGVTTELGMMGDPAVARRLRAEEAATGAPARAALYSAGWAVTVAGGLGTEDEVVPTLGDGEDGVAFVAARRAEGSDYIEVMLDDGSGWGRPHPTLSREQLAGVIAAAHRGGTIAMVDIATHDEAARAIEAGADGLAHLYIEGPDPALARRIAASGAFVMATLPVLHSICDGTRGAALADDPAIAPFLMPGSELALRQSYALFSPGTDCGAIRAAAHELSTLGVPILAGTDAGSPGTTHGASLHDALALLVEAGLTPTEALIAATSAPARAFHLERIGRIAPGKRADLVLVDGDPTRDIRATRAIAAVWKAGVMLDRSRQSAAATAARPTFRVDLLTPGPLGEFEDDDGDGWQVRSDRVRGGGSEAELLLIDRDKKGGGALQVAGRIAAGRGPGWAGAIRFLAAEPPAPVDLGQAESLHFAARGDGGTYRVLLFTLRGGPAPVELATFATGARWTEHAVSLAGRPDRGEVVAILVSGGPAPGDFRFELDDVALR
jgi:imidazolonepropionase-like amidohydrolase